MRITLFSSLILTEAVLAISPGRPWPTQTRAWPTQTACVIPMIPTYTTPVVLPKICLAFDWPTQMKIPRTAPAFGTGTVSKI